MFRLIVIFLCVFILHFFIVFYFFFLIRGKLGNAKTTKLKQISQVHSAQDVLLNFNSVSANNYIYIYIYFVGVYVLILTQLLIYIFNLEAMQVNEVGGVVTDLCVFVRECEGRR